MGSSRTQHPQTLEIPSYLDNYALMDCNNFFVSCERVFNPKLRNIPVVVLSNNDGCIISRSNEAKKLGIPMGAVVFEWRNLLDRNNVALCSGNFTLYKDMSDRVFQTLQEFSDRIEIYSIDEAFFRLNPGKEHALLDFCSRIRETIYRNTGIPVSIGVGKNKTQAKLANKFAKKYYEERGVAAFSRDMLSSSERPISLDDIWGIGYRSVKKLPVFDINTLTDFMKADRTLLKQYFGVVMERTWLELHGVRCHPLSTSRSSKKGILCSRTFRYAHGDFGRIRESIANYTANAARNLRKQSSLAGSVGVFLSTRKHNVSHMITQSYFTHLDSPTAHTPSLAKVALDSLTRIYQLGETYKRAGVYFSDLYDFNEVQQNMFVNYTDKSEDTKTMSAVDYLNLHWGIGTVKFANQGINKEVVIEQSKRSPRYTTNWLELPVISSRHPKVISRYQT